MSSNLTASASGRSVQPFRVAPYTRAVDVPAMASYIDGVAAIRRLADRFGREEWQKPSACEGWRAVDLAGHVLAVANWWHEWLDRAEAGDASPPFHWNDLPGKNAEALAALPPGSGPARVAEFAERALAYAERARPAWDLPFGCPPGTVSQAEMTVGLHFRIAPAEWHLHAWDLARALGEMHRPGDPAIILDGLSAVFGFPPPEGDAWDAVLLVSGRARAPA